MLHVAQDLGARAPLVDCCTLPTLSAPCVCLTPRCGPLAARRPAADFASAPPAASRPARWPFLCRAPACPGRPPAADLLIAEPRTGSFKPLGWDFSQSCIISRKPILALIAAAGAAAARRRHSSARRQARREGFCGCRWLHSTLITLSHSELRPASFLGARPRPASGLPGSCRGHWRAAASPLPRARVVHVARAMPITPVGPGAPRRCPWKIAMAGW